jgi:glutaminyl-tRNA synthetase
MPLITSRERPLWSLSKVDNAHENENAAVEPGHVPSTNFIRAIIDEDLASGKHDFIITRFPPEPNGYLHIGHAKSICLNFGLARDYKGRCHMRFDDTNPSKEEDEYVQSILHDIRWLGFDWGTHLYYASDFFEKMYQLAVKLITDGKAYVCALSREEFSANYRGSLSEDGKPSPYRDRPVSESLDLFARMRAGEFKEGELVLRAKIDMSSPNMLMRDPPLYRIMHASHHRTGDAWCIYPMYDYAHPLEDAIEQITHSICTLEFENNRELYDWVVEHTGAGGAKPPHQYEFARLSLTNTVMSKRKLLQLVKEGFVDGWDDPRMPTIAGLRRRGITPEAVRAFADMIGVARANSTVDIDKLEYCVRDDLNTRAPRVMAVLNPLKVTITNYPEGQTEELDTPYWPHDVPNEGSRAVPFTRELYIEQDDFALDPPKKWRRLSPGMEVRLRYAYVVRCDEVITDDAGEVVELRCSYDPATRDGDNAGRKNLGIIHWVSATDNTPITARLYDRLFTVERPDAEPDFIALINPHSLVTAKGFGERSLAGAKAEDRFQFERQGYFYADPIDSKDGKIVYNRIVGLKDSWARIAQEADGASATVAPSAAPTSTRVNTRPEKRTRAELRAMAREADAELAARHTRYQAELGLSAEDADVLSGDRPLGDFYEAARAAYTKDGHNLTTWFINELLGLLKDEPIDAIKLTPPAFAALVTLVDDDTITALAAKELLLTLVQEGGDPVALVDARGLRQLNDAAQLGPIIDAIIAQNADKVAAYRSGKTNLLGFFIGQVTRSTGGKANPQLTRQLLEQKLA